MVPNCLTYLTLPTLSCSHLIIPLVEEGTETVISTLATRTLTDYQISAYWYYLTEDVYYVEPPTEDRSSWLFSAIGRDNHDYYISPQVMENTMCELTKAFCEGEGVE